MQIPSAPLQILFVCNCCSDERLCDCDGFGNASAAATAAGEYKNIIVVVVVVGGGGTVTNCC